jgi:phenylpyruvate tautomerase PptA (4-oxalocrotonate tautomerase family)
MPVITIRSLAKPDDSVAASKRIATAIADAAHMAARDIWLVWTPIAPRSYVVNGEAPDAQPDDTHPPLVEISSAAGRPADVVEAMLKATAEAIAAELHVTPLNVRVVFAEVPSRRIYSRGRYQ